MTPPAPDNTRGFPADDTRAFGAVAPFYEHLMAGVPYRFWLQYIEQVWAAHHIAPCSVLDLACGTGTFSRLLAQKGFAVVGVDISDAMLQIARIRAQEAGLSIPFVCQDAAELSLPQAPFDAALSLFDSLNYILQPERLAQAFARVCEHLAPGGAFLFDLNTEYALAEGFFNQSCTRKDEPLHYRWRSRYDPQTRLCAVTMRFTHTGGNDDPQTFTEVHWQRAYHKEEIFRWLREAGFTRALAYDAYTLEPPHKRSDRLFYLAVK